MKRVASRGQELLHVVLELGTAALAAADALVVVFTAIPATCLTLWAIAGAALARMLARPRVAAWSIAMGALLVATALALVSLP